MKAVLFEGYQSKASVLYRIVVLSLIFVIFVSILTPLDVHGLSIKNQKAHVAYEKAMEKGTIPTTFEDEDGYPQNIVYTYFDIDKDGYDELIQYHDPYPPLTHLIWTYHKGKVKKLIGNSHGGISIYPKTHIVYTTSQHLGIIWSGYYKISKGKAKLVASAEKSMNDDGSLSKTTTKIKGKKVTNFKYKKYTKKIKSGKAKNLSGLNWSMFYNYNGYWQHFYDYGNSKKNETYYIAVPGSEYKQGVSVIANADTTDHSSLSRIVKYELCDSKKTVLPKDSTQQGVPVYKLKKNKMYYLKVKVSNKKYKGVYHSEFGVYLSSDDIL
jgi:hypothetical protein